VVFIFYNFGSVWENRKVIVNGSGYEQCSPYQFRLTPGLKTLTEAHPSVTREQGKQEHADGSPVWLDAGVRRRLEGAAPELPLSSDYEGSQAAEASSFFTIFP
jgi:hypothetical protein